MQADRRSGARLLQDTDKVEVLVFDYPVQESAVARHSSIVARSDDNHWIREWYCGSADNAEDPGGLKVQTPIGAWKGMGPVVTSVRWVTWSKLRSALLRAKDAVGDEYQLLSNNCRVFAGEVCKLIGAAELLQPCSCAFFRTPTGLRC